MRRGWLSLGALFVLPGAALPACDDGTTAQRGFASRQVLALRDPTFQFYYAQRDLVFYETGLDFSGNGTPTFWSLDIATGDTTNYGSTMPDLSMVFPPTGAPPAPRYHCHYDTAPDGVSETFTVEDTQAGTSTEIENAVWTSPYCPADDDPSIRVWRGESDGTYSLWSGPYTDLQQVSLPLVVGQVMWHETGSRWLVAGMDPTAPAALGLYALADDDPTVATEIVPAELGSAAWAAGATASTTLASSSLAHTNYFWPATSGQVYSYERAMADGSTAMFVGPYDDAIAREQALFPVVPASGLEILRIEPYNYRYDGKWPLTTAWDSVEGPSQTVTFRIWRDASRRLAACPWAGSKPAVALADPPGENALFMNTQDCCSLEANSALLLMVPNADDGNPCRVLAPDNVGVADFSPDGTALAWLVEAPGVKQQLWTAARDGSGAREIGEGLINGIFSLSSAPHFIADSRLELTLDQDLVWVDVHDDPVQMHYITERTAGLTIDLGRYVVTVHDYSNQDSNGPLALINRETGATRTISPGVVEYTSPDVPPLYQTRPGIFNDDGAPIRIVYLVRGRNPSAQDGLWIATITAQDRQ